MANTTYVGREARIQYTPSGGAATTLGVAELCELDIEQELIRVPQIGSHTIADIKEGEELVSGRLKKAYVDGALLDRITRNANGYLTEFTVTFRVKDMSGSSPYPYRLITASNCKAKKWSHGIPARGGVIHETLEFEAKSWTITTGTEA